MNVNFKWESPTERFILTLFWPIHSRREQQVCVCVCVMVTPEEKDAPYESSLAWIPKLGATPDVTELEETLRLTLGHPLLFFFFFFFFPRRTNKTKAAFGCSSFVSRSVSVRLFNQFCGSAKELVWHLKRRLIWGAMCMLCVSLVSSCFPSGISKRRCNHFLA